MRYIELYIAGKRVDLDSQSFVLFNYTMEDLSNPTIVKNSFSQQITLKGTDRNNEVFGAIYRMDRISSHNAFNAARKTPFVIYNEKSEIVESGYVKLNEVVRKGKDIEYQISLFGGLGSFFYGLMYNEDGSKRTLDGMAYTDSKGVKSNSFVRPGGFNHEQVHQGWSALSTNTDADWSMWNVVNFAPVYNGFADGFDANKAVMTTARYDNVATNPTIEGESCTFKTGTSSTLATFSNKHDMWEVRDMRWYLLRPIMNVKSILSAIADPDNNGGYEVVMELGDIVSSPLYTESWVTLPMIKPEDKGRTDVFHTILSGTKSPAEYLISFAKILGLVFLYDKGMKRVTIRKRTDFYAEQKNEILDITKRVDISSLNIVPVLGDSHFYQMGGGAIGEWAEQYKETYGLDYAVQRINTGNEFNLDTKKITEEVIYKDGVDVQERSHMFQSDGYQILYNEDGSPVERQYFMLPLYEEVKMQYFTTSNQDSKETTLVARELWDRYHFNNEHPNVDWLPKLQLHGKDNKSVDGADVLLIYNGKKTAPEFPSDRYLEYFLSDDTNDMMVLNEDVPCWNLTTENVISLTSLPSFRRHRTHTDGVTEYPDSGWDWGTPKERGVNGFEEGLSPTIYNKYWRNYLTDRYDDDTFVLKCKVDFRGMDVGQELLGRFFFYDGAIFVLNAIKNHSLTTWDLTECEFVKVQDINNYTE